MSATVSPVSAATITEWSERIANAELELTRDQARALLEVEPGTEAYAALMQGAQHIRQQRLGDIVHMCSILNTKAGGCSENCSFCAQAGGSKNDDYEKHRWLDDDQISEVASSAADNGAEALGLVAAWRGVKKGKQLDMVCESIRRLSQDGKIRADVNLGILESQEVADAIADAGAKVYGHNLETAASFYGDVCSTHSFEERMETIKYVKNAGMGLCSGGIFGMGENVDQRIEFADQLRFIEPDMIPINFLMPFDGTRQEGADLIDPDEALTCLAMLRFYLPDRNIMAAGGKELVLEDRKHEIFAAGVNAVMVGNYLTSMGTSAGYWHEALAQYGLRPENEKAGGANTGCGSSCGCN